MSVPNDPTTLLLPDDWPDTFMKDKWAPATFGIFGFFCPGGHNYTNGRPFFSGIQKHIAGATLGVIIGRLLFERRRSWLADRDAMFRHYIELHPDDFPIPERRYLKDVFKPWRPCR